MCADRNHNIAEFTLNKQAPYQGLPAVLHHFTPLQQGIKPDEAQPGLTHSPPNNVVKCLDLDGRHRDVLYHTLNLSFTLPKLQNHTPLGVYLPRSERIWFSTEKEYSIDLNAHCEKCNKKLSQGAWLLPYATGAKWFCSCILPEPRLNNLVAILDWWHYRPWWADLEGRYTNKQRIAPFCDTKLFIAMSKRLIDAEGFHRSDAPGATKERLRSLWRGIEGQELPGDPVLQQMCLDSLHPERWPDAIQEADNLIAATLSTPGRWAEIVKDATSQPWLDLRDGYLTGVLAAIPANTKRKTENHVLTQQSSEGFGAPKQRGTLKLKVIQSTRMEQRKYPAIRYLFSDHDGRLFRWDASLPSAPTLMPDTWYTMDATIREHLHQGHSVLTLIYHCTHFDVSDDSAPTPCFTKTSSQRALKDAITLSWQNHNETGGIDGLSYVNIERSWTEEERTHHFSVTLPWPIVCIKPILDAINAVGLHRSEHTTSPHTALGALDPKLDKALLKALEGIAPPSALSADKWPVLGYWVDDGYTTFAGSHHKDTARDGASPMERQWRKPHWFFEMGEAQSHSRKLMMGRISTLRFQAPVVACCDLAMRGEPTYPIFLDAARNRGVNFLYEWDTGRILPLTPDGAEIIEQRPEHAPWPTQAHYHLKGRQFLLYAPTPLDLRGDVLHGAITRDRASLLQPHPILLETQKRHTPLTVRDFLNAMIESSQRAWLYAPADPLTCYYLRMLGAKCWWVSETGAVDTGVSSETVKGPARSLPCDDPHTWCDWLTELKELNTDRAIA